MVSGITVHGIILVLIKLGIWQTKGFPSAHFLSMNWNSDMDSVFAQGCYYRLTVEPDDFHDHVGSLTQGNDGIDHLLRANL